MMHAVSRASIRAAAPKVDATHTFGVQGSELARIRDDDKPQADSAPKRISATVTAIDEAGARRARRHARQRPGVGAERSRRVLFRSRSATRWRSSPARLGSFRLIAGNRATAVTKCSDMAEILPFFAVPFGFAKLDNCAPLNQELRSAVPGAQRGGRRARESATASRNATRRSSKAISDCSARPSAASAAQGILLAASDQVRVRLERLRRRDAQPLADLLGRLVPRHAPRRLLRSAQSSRTHRGPACIASIRASAAAACSRSSIQMLTSTMYLDAANASHARAFASGVRQIDLEPGQLVLFPSWSLHDVKPYEGDGERITVAFNWLVSAKGRSVQR
jgi:hypothetical protein